MRASDPPLAIRVRTAAVADVAAMHRVRKAARENRLSDPRRVSEADYLPYVEAGSAWVAETDFGFAGFAALDARTGGVWALFVDPGAEGAGVGRALHLRMLEWARERGIGRLSLQTEAGSRAARFYDRAGWLRTGGTDAGDILFAMSLRT